MDLPGIVSDLLAFHAFAFSEPAAPPRGAAGDRREESALRRPDEVYQALNSQKDDGGHSDDEESLLHRLVVLVHDQPDRAAAHSDDENDADQLALEDVDDVIKLGAQAKGIRDVCGEAGSRGCKEVEKTDGQNSTICTSGASYASSFNRLCIGNCRPHPSQAALSPLLRPSGRNQGRP